MDYLETQSNETQVMVASGFIVSVWIFSSYFLVTNTWADNTRYHMMWYGVIYGIGDILWYIMWCDVIWYDIWCDMIYMGNDMIMIWYDIHGKWYMTWHDIYDVMWCDVMWCGVMWCHVMWCDVIWYDMIRYDMIYDMIWYHMIWYGCYEVTWCERM